MHPRSLPRWAIAALAALVVMAFAAAPTPAATTDAAADASVVVDTDADGVPDADDNCAALANADQADYDADGAGDACDPPTAGGVCLLAKRDVLSSARFLALSPSRRASVDRNLSNLCASADSIAARLTPSEEPSLLAQFNDAIARAVAQQYLTAAQAATLEAAASTL
jgi:hypothetical protein